MKKTLGVAFALALCFLLSASAAADTVGYQTASIAEIYPVSGFRYLENNSVVAGPSQYSTSGSFQLSGGQLPSYLIYRGDSVSERGDLHASSSFTISGDAPTPPSFAGVAMRSDWYEFGVHAVTIGPGDLLTGITAYKVSWKLDGNIDNVSANNYAELISFITQNGVTTTSFAKIERAGPFSDTISFYLQPHQLDQSFDLEFMLYTRSATTSQFSHRDGSVDFQNTATFGSMEAVDANGNTVSGVDLALSDGTLLTKDGIETETPEPSSILLLGTATIGLFGMRRRSLAV